MMIAEAIVKDFQIRANLIAKGYSVAINPPVKECKREDNTGESLLMGYLFGGLF